MKISSAFAFVILLKRPEDNHPKCRYTMPGPASEPLAMSFLPSGLSDWFVVDRSGAGVHASTKAFVRLCSTRLQICISSLILASVKAMSMASRAQLLTSFPCFLSCSLSVSGHTHTPSLSLSLLLPRNQKPKNLYPILAWCPPHTKPSEEMLI